MLFDGLNGIVLRHRCVACSPYATARACSPLASGATVACARYSGYLDSSCFEFDRFGEHLEMVDIRLSCNKSATTHTWSSTQKYGQTLFRAKGVEVCEGLRQHGERAGNSLR
jgi:hypothetical protein